MHTHPTPTANGDHTWMEDTALTTLTWIGGECGHEIGDYLAQLDYDALRKQGWAWPHKPAWRGDERTACERVREGKISLTRHVATYALSQAAARYAIYRTAGICPPARAVALGCLAEALAHGVIDHGLALDTFIRATKKARFAELGQPRDLLPVVETPGGTHEVLLVEPDTDGKPARDDDGHLIVVDAPHDNPTATTGRWTIDQALHRSAQFLLGTALTLWATKRARRRRAAR